jgi:hypothetical protein
MRLLPLAGVVFVALLVVTIVTSNNTPDTGATGEAVIKFYKDNQNQQRLSNLLGAYGVVFFLIFANVLRAHLRPSSPDLATLGFAGAILIGVGGASFSAFGFALSDVPDKLNPGAAQALNVLGSDFFFPIAIGTSLFLFTAGLAVIRGRSLPVWLGWIALPIGVIAVTPIGFVAFVGLMAWVLVTSILMFIRNRRPSPA